MDAWRGLSLSGRARLHIWVLLGELMIDIEHALAKGYEIIEGVSGVAINCDMPVDARGKSSFEVEVGPVYVNEIFTDLRDNGLEFSMVFEDRAGALCHILNREGELTSIICVSKVGLECLDELVEGRKLGGRRVLHHEPEFYGAGEERCRSFHFRLFVSGCSDRCTNLEDPGIDDGEGCVLSREEWRLRLFQHRSHHGGRKSLEDGCHAGRYLSS